jgi:5-methylcytosine-specific restriction endonuclease McrA
MLYVIKLSTEDETPVGFLERGKAVPLSASHPRRRRVSTPAGNRCNAPMAGPRSRGTIVDMKRSRSPFVLTSAGTSDTAVHVLIEALAQNHEHYGISAQLERMICVSATCRRCDAPVGELQDHLACWGTFMEFEFPLDHGDSVFAETARELERVRSFKRHRRVRAADGVHSKEQIQGMFTAQLERCYYCFAQLKDDAGKQSFHRDHLVPLKLGGTNYLQNIVLSCSSCNSKKRLTLWQQFSRDVSRTLPPETREALKAMRQGLSRWRSKQPAAVGSHRSRLFT